MFWEGGFSKICRFFFDMLKKISHLFSHLLVNCLANFFVDVLDNFGSCLGPVLVSLGQFGRSLGPVWDKFGASLTWLRVADVT